MKQALLILLLVALSSCQKPASSSTPPPGGGGGSFDERQACSTDKDCVAVEVECCDHCNGGLVVGIHRDYAAEVRNAYTPADECGEAACTKRGCVDEPVALCRQGVCGLRLGDREDTPALPPP
jgi:hypothetical protein